MFNGNGTSFYGTLKRPFCRRLMRTLHDKVTIFSAPGLVTLIIPRHARPGIESAVSAEWSGVPTLPSPSPSPSTGPGPRGAQTRIARVSKTWETGPRAAELVMAHPHLTLTLIIITQVYLFLCFSSEKYFCQEFYRKKYLSDRRKNFKRPGERCHCVGGGPRCPVLI